MKVDKAKKRIEEYLLNKKGYQKVHPAIVASKLYGSNCYTEEQVNLVKEVQKSLREMDKHSPKNWKWINPVSSDKDGNAFYERKPVENAWTINKKVELLDARLIPDDISIETFHRVKEILESKVRIKESNSTKSISEPIIEPYTKGDPNNVLTIGDLHSPFILKEYLQFCRNLQEKYNCGTVIFIGDLVDSHSWSFHTPNPDGLSVGDEINACIKQLQAYYYTFPVAIVLFGNHDLLVARKAKEAGLSERFIKDFGDIIEAPKTWSFTHEFIKDNVKYIHGSVGNAIKRAREERVSIVQGHLHSEAFVSYAVSEKDAIFGMQLGCGIDRTKYAFEYAQPFPKKPVISAGVVLENGTLPIIELMKL